MCHNHESAQLRSFKALVWDFYQQYGRHFPWRNIDNPYHIVISEVMLQQTQTFRVEPKYEEFIHAFNNFESLATASLHDVLSVWQGLGYNRRAKMLHLLAQKIVAEHNGILPAKPEILETLPGIGKATASSICAFAFNLPTVFIETNIRTVFIAHFFKNKQEVHDREIIPLVRQTVDQTNPREWYYALMDYGVFLKKQTKNKMAKQSSHYTRQSRFEGSDRQIRGAILKALIKAKTMHSQDLINVINKDPERTKCIIEQLIKEELIQQLNDQLSIS